MRLAFLSLVLLACAPNTHALLKEPILPVPAEHGQDPRKVALGRELFFDTDLSRDRRVACATCHKPDWGGADDRFPSTGAHATQGVIKTPTVFNARFNIAQFWDGRAATLEEQLDGPIHDPREMDSSWPLIIERLKEKRDFRKRFERVFPGGIDETSLKAALVAFEKSLITPGSPFDRWLQGDARAISDAAKRGYRLFKSYGCIACHQGINVGGNLFQRMGVRGDYFAERRRPISRVDLGRYNVTADPDDRFYFKVPGLRTVALQRYFFHDGEATSLDQAIQLMGRYQLGIDIPAGKRQEIAEFLRSLLGRHPLLESP